MDMQQVFALMERFAASPLTGLEVALEGGRVKLEKSIRRVISPADAPTE